MVLTTIFVAFGRYWFLQIQILIDGDSVVNSKIKTLEDILTLHYSCKEHYVEDIYPFFLISFMLWKKLNEVSIMRCYIIHLSNSMMWSLNLILSKIN